MAEPCPLRATSFFKGTGLGQFQAFRADTGAKLWSAPTQSGVIAGPISYSVNGQQYVAVLAGWGGVWTLAAGEVSPAESAHGQRSAHAGLQAGR